MKSSGTRHRIMAALMISSQLLLTAFVLYWLLGQYRDERNKLHEQLEHEYLTVHEQLLDSLLMVDLVIPSLDDSIMVKIHEKASFESHHWIDSANVIVERKELGLEVPDDIQLHSIHVDGSFPADSGISSIDVTSVISDEERMVKSVKLFISQNQEVFQVDSGLHILALQNDSSSLLMNMEQCLEDRGWTFTLDWPVEGHAPAPTKKVRGMLIQGGPGGYLPGLRVERFSAYLLRSMLPQILFALILLLLSGSALLFAYRSLLRQITLNRLRDDFISNISHELKTPVSTVKVALEALRTYDLQQDPELSGEYLDMAGKEVDRLERLIGKVLHHQVLNNAALVLDREEFDLGDLARNIVRTLDIPIREKGASVEVSEEDGPCMVSADRIYVEGMITNLIDNSLKYTQEKPEILIRISCTPDGNSLSVSDNGPGIPEEYKDQVFEKFFRIPAGNKHNVKGYGLGLNFASQVMARHGGSISFTNLPENGCRFTLHFPSTKA